MSTATAWVGRFHPLLLHFPIVLAWVGAAIEGWRLKCDNPAVAKAVTWSEGIGALSALAVTASGWALAAHEHMRQDYRLTLEWHRWLGTGATALLALAWLAAKSRSKDSTNVGRWIRRLAVWGSACLVTAAAHLGAVIVWGRDWFSS